MIVIASVYLQTVMTMEYVMVMIFVLGLMIRLMLITIMSRMVAKFVMVH